ncbi:MAG: hypothetical protein ABIE84_06640 [bacterium]
MKKTFLPVVLLLLVSFLISPVAAQNKIVRKTVTKIVRPPIAATPAPQKIETDENVPLPPPPPTSQYEVALPGESKGLFGWGINTDLNGVYATTVNQNGLLGLLGGRVNMLFTDPAMIGTKLGLAEDALEYKAGLGLIFGSSNSRAAINSIPLYADAVLYLREKSFFGQDPYVGIGLSLNLYGTGGISGGMGSQLYGGLLFDFGSSMGKMGISAGMQTLNVGTALSASGVFFQVTQPFIL